MARRGESIYKRKDGRWEARYNRALCPGEKKVLASVYGKTYTEAKNKRILALQHSSVYLSEKANDPLILNALLWDWLGWNRSQIKASTYQKYEGLIRNHIQENIGNMAVSNLSHSALMSFAQTLRVDGNTRTGGPLAAKTVNSVLSIIGSAIDWSEACSCSFKIPFLKETRSSPQTFSPAEQNILEEYIYENLNGYTFGILLSLYTGMRLGEICALERRDMHDGLIYVHKTMQRTKTLQGKWEICITEPKTQNSCRVIPIPAKLKVYLQMLRKPSGYILTQDNGKFIEPRLMQKRFSLILGQLGLPQKPFHSLRHTFATKMIDNGCDPKTVSELLGHANVQITLNRYVHPSLEMKKKAINKI